ncbi:MAG: hypothetical protein H6828_13110 [Planctomycetes bacterium]|nr:hypothetical protein [Planctomycetota bacterium]
MLRTLASLALATLVAPLSAQVADGDLLVPRFDVGVAAIEQYDAHGTLLVDHGPGSDFSGATVTDAGLVATLSRYPTEVHFFDASGTEVGSFSSTQGAGAPGDLDRLSDGTLVAADQSGDVDLYAPDGTWLGHLFDNQMIHPTGLFVTPQDEVWVADIDLFTSPGRLHRFDGQGNLLQIVSLGFSPGDLVVDADGTLWVTDRFNALVVHLDAQGAPLSSFATQALGRLYGIALHRDDTLSVVGENDVAVHRYAKDGTWLSSFPLASTAGLRNYLCVQRDAGTPTFCYGDGTGSICPCANLGAPGQGCAHSGGVGGRLGGFGRASLTNDGLLFDAGPLPPNQPALLFAGTATLNGGAGLLFGDGLRCVGGAVVRLGVRTSDAAGRALWRPGLLGGHGWSAGQSVHVQAWYRDPHGSPCGSGFNLTNATSVALAP